MDEFNIVRSLLLRIGRGLPASAPLARAVIEWAQPHADWLLAGPRADDGALDWEALLAGLGAAKRSAEARAPVLQLSDELARMLALARSTVRC